jgi:hypothetical protein
MNGKKRAAGEAQATSHAVEVGGHVGSLYLLDSGAPPYELRIDKEGRWFHEGVEIVRDDIRNLFSRHLVLSEDGGFSVKIGNDECPVTVEDAPFVVVRVTMEPDGRLVLLLNDKHMEALDPGTIRIKRSNVPYCRVRNGLEARFSRAAYYQLAEFIEYDESRGRYLLIFDEETTELEIVEEGAR